MSSNLHFLQFGNKGALILLFQLKYHTLEIGLFDLYFKKWSNVLKYGIIKRYVERGSYGYFRNSSKD